MKIALAHAAGGAFTAQCSRLGCAHKRVSRKGGAKMDSCRHSGSTAYSYTPLSARPSPSSVLCSLCCAVPPTARLHYPLHVYTYSYTSLPTPTRPVLPTPTHPESRIINGVFSTLRRTHARPARPAHEATARRQQNIFLLRDHTRHPVLVGERPPARTASCPPPYASMNSESASASNKSHPSSSSSTILSVLISLPTPLVPRAFALAGVAAVACSSWLKSSPNPAGVGGGSSGRVACARRPSSGAQHTAHRFPSTSPACASGTSTACVCATKHTSYSSIASAVVNAPPGADVLAVEGGASAYVESASVVDSDSNSDDARCAACGGAVVERDQTTSKGSLMPR
ncbi:hypothetical protein GSI_11024 [Ganoderma sinense ZZ0214-1]|uniref:Uncharacterized protein n=1 Tax=Ganoderma sinense ZZ0214-1 TaxID=1077348 RepID=A0A2G8RZD3_9APHY|nr:hypothetical protein GSI_11024 [Ganoderma sinense ZZ0214-1]